VTTREPRRAGSRSRQAPARDEQRARLLPAIVEIVARSGYPDAKVADIARRAGVSRATFYELFANKEACLLSAQAEFGERLSDELAARVAGGEPSRAAQSALTALVEFAEREPLTFDFLMHEAMLAGPAARAQRDRLMGRLEDAVERSWARSPEDLPLLDMSAKIMLEGTIRLLGLRMRRDGDTPRQMLSDLLAWIDSYTVSARTPLWRGLVAHPTSRRAAADHPVPPSLRRSPPRGRHGLGADVVRTLQRERISYATAEAIRSKGYADITVADIVATAGLSRDVFYAHCHDKEEAFDGAVQLLFERLLAPMASAFFGYPGDWPDQVWEAGWAFDRFLEGDPSLANFLFVATYAPPAHIERVHEFVLAFTVFVEAGNRYRPPTAQVPRVITEAIVCSVLEAVNFQIRHDRVGSLRGLIPTITYMVYAPFMGAEQAGEFVESKIDAAYAERSS
jgi:AcrR family transcriptional regulator